MTAMEKALQGDAPLKGGMLWLVAVVLAGANFIAVLDMTIANVSVHSIAGALGISSSQGTWVITCYSVAEAITVPLTGWLAARFGAVRVFTTAMGAFGLFSLWCGFSSSFTEEERRELEPILLPLREPPGFTGKAPGGPSRWAQGRSTEWEPLRPALVCEVRYDHFSGGRFRHGTKFLRWRPEKKPAQCTFEQVRPERGHKVAS